MGFRAFAQREAAKLNLVGWVRNLRNGSVEAMAQGHQEAMAEFEKRLQEGPRAGLVDQITVKSARDSQGWFDFQILQDGVDSCIKK